MESAGRILLMPKGDYSAGTTYTMLDLVNHSGASWVCKKDCTGQEPSDSNTEYWQRFGTAVDLANYLPKTGGTIDGNIYIGQTTSEGNRTLSLRNNKRMVNIQVFADGSFRVYDGTNDKNIVHSTADGTNTFNGTASGNLPLDGGGTVTAPSGSNTAMSIRGNNTVGFSLLSYQDLNKTVLGRIGFKAIDMPTFMTSDGKYNDILHTGNKPTGTYTGNGDATVRTINTGGIGKACIVYGNGHSFIATPLCTFCANYNSNVVSALKQTEYTFNDGKIGIATDGIANASGVTYTYWVL